MCRNHRCKFLNAFYMNMLAINGKLIKKQFFPYHEHISVDKIFLPSIIKNSVCSQQDKGKSPARFSWVAENKSKRQLKFFCERCKTLKVFLSHLSAACTYCVCCLQNSSCGHITKSNWGVEILTKS